MLINSYHTPAVFMLFQSLLPEIFLVSVILLQMSLNSFVVNNKSFNFPLIIKETGYQTIFILIVLLFLFLNAKIELISTWGVIEINSAVTLLKFVVCIFGILTCFLLIPALTSQKLNFNEVFTLFLLSIFSILLLICSNNLLSLYLTLEMQTICFYILSAYSRNSAFSTEAGLKYFISGSFISGCFLLGVALIYSFLGTVSLMDMAYLLMHKLTNLETSYFLMIGILFITSTLLFKLACAPFHFWAPDVYEGAPLSSTVIFALVPKIGLVYFFSKWVFCIGFFLHALQPLLIAVGIFSCLVGTLFALNQKRLKRVIIYSSVAQTGFIVAGLSLNTLSATTAVLVFLIIYLITSFLIWGHIVLFYYFQFKARKILSFQAYALHLTSLSGLFMKNQVWAISLLIIFFSIAGIPPLTGFLAKVFILVELTGGWYFSAAVALLVISSISVYYYIRVIKSIFFEPNILLSTKEAVFQVIFLNTELKKIYFIFSALLFSLLIIFFFPTNLYLFCAFISFSYFPL